MIAKMHRGKLMRGGALLAVGHSAAYNDVEELEDVMRVDRQQPAAAAPRLDPVARVRRGKGTTDTATYGAAQALPPSTAGSVAAAYGQMSTKNMARGQVGHASLSGQGIASLSEKLRMLDVKKSGYRGIQRS